MERWQRFNINNVPIRYKLIYFFLLVSIIPAVGLGLLVDWQTARIIEKQTNDNTFQLIGKVNKALEFHAGNMQNVTYFTANKREVQRFMKDGTEALTQDDRYELRKFLQNFITLYPEIAGILLANADGEYVSNEMYARTDSPLTEDSWYREAVENKGIFKIIGHPVERNLANHNNYKDTEVVSVVRAIYDTSRQRVLGVVLIDLKMRVIAETVKDVHLGKTGYLMVIDQSGKNIYLPQDPVVREIPREWIGDHFSGTFSKKVSDKTYQFIYRTSPFTNWTTVGVFSARESVPEVQEIRFYLVSFVFFGCLFGLTASLYLSYSISKPIGQLMSFMNKAESGDLAIRYIGKRDDEIGMLGRSFNKMLAQINRLLSLTKIQERQQREAELRSLQAYIKPHFLYNTLDTVHWMARNRGQDDMADVIASLSKLFRIGLSKGQDMILFAEEIEHVRSYLIIQKTRYREKLNYSIDIAPNVQHRHVMKFMLQPIVENAIYHGIKERRGPGHIHIEAAEEKDRLIIRVHDDGKGMTREKLAELRSALSDTAMKGEGSYPPPPGYGLRNVHARLQLTFGDAYGISMESEAGQGTTVTILHPLLTEKDRKKE